VRERVMVIAMPLRMEKEAGVGRCSPSQRRFKNDEGSQKERNVGGGGGGGRGGGHLVWERVKVTTEMVSYRRKNAQVSNEQRTGLGDFFPVCAHRSTQG